MKNVIEHIDYVKGKPHHVRRRVALATAAGGTLFIAIVWFAVSSMTGSFAIQGNTFAASTNADGSASTTSEKADTSALAGAAAALPDSAASDSQPARIEIVDTNPAPATKKTDQTTLPF